MNGLSLFPYLYCKTQLTSLLLISLARWLNLDSEFKLPWVFDISTNSVCIGFWCFQTVLLLFSMVHTIFPSCSSYFKLSLLCSNLHLTTILLTCSRWMHCQLHWEENPGQKWDFHQFLSLTFIPSSLCTSTLSFPSYLDGCDEMTSDPEVHIKMWTRSHTILFLPFPSPEELPNPGTEPGSPALQADSSPPEPPGKLYDIVVVVQLPRCVWFFVSPWSAARQASLSFSISQTLLKLMSIESVMPSSHLILCFPLLFLPSIFPSIRDFSNELAVHIRWPKYWSFNFSISPFSEDSGLISFKMDWLDLLAVQGTLRNLQHHSSKASILWWSTLFTVQLSQLYLTAGKTIALTIWTFVGRVMSLLFNTLSCPCLSPSPDHFKHLSYQISSYMFLSPRI